MAKGDARKCSHVISTDLLLSTPGPFLHSAMVCHAASFASRAFSGFTLDASRVTRRYCSLYTMECL